MTAWEADNLFYRVKFFCLVVCRIFFKLCKLGESARCRPVTFPVWHWSPAVTCEGWPTAVNDGCILCFTPPLWHIRTGKDAHTHAHTHTVPAVEWINHLSLSSTPMLLTHQEHNKSQIRSAWECVCVSRGVDSLESTGPVLNLILNGRQNFQRKTFIGHKMTFLSFHFLTLWERLRLINAGSALPAHAWCSSFNWVL